MNKLGGIFEFLKCLVWADTLLNYELQLDFFFTYTKSLQYVL